MNRIKKTKLILCGLLSLAIFSFIPLVNAEPPEDRRIGWPAYIFKKDGYLPPWSPWYNPDLAPGFFIGAWYYAGIGGEWWVPANEYCFFRTGWIVSDYEIKTGLDPGPPYQNHLYINGQKITMQRWVWTIKKNEILFPDGKLVTSNSRAWMWIARFEPGYFKVGKIYEIRLQFMVKKPYQTDVSGGLTDSKKWRPYVNYMSGGGPPDAPWTWEDWLGPVGVPNDQVHYLHVFEP